MISQGPGRTNSMKFLISGYLPSNFDPSTVTPEMGAQIHGLNADLEAAGALFFACGLAPHSQTKTLSAGPNEKVLITDGPYIEAKEFIGGFLIIDVASQGEALAWAERSARIGMGPVEVRPIFFNEG